MPHKKRVSFIANGKRVSFECKVKKPKYATTQAMIDGMQRKGVHPNVIAQAVKLRETGRL